MIHKIQITNHLGESILLELRNPEKSGFFIKSIEGLGPSTVNINTTSPLGLDGVIVNSSKVNQRNLVFNLGFYDETMTVEEVRKLSYKYFPLKRPLTIIIETDSRVGKTTGFVESNEPNIFSKQSDTLISILCPNPYFEDIESVETMFSGVISMFEFPFENPSLTEKLIEFSELSLDTRDTVYYTGDAQTGVLITIDFLGAASGLTIYNITAVQTLSINSTKLAALTGSGFVLGDRVYISTIKGSKYIYLLRNGVIYNILNTIDISNDWFTIDSGDNVFAFTATSGQSNVQLRISHNVLYEGL